MSNSPGPGRRARLLPLLFASALLAFASRAGAVDEEGCLGCHGLAGFAGRSGGETRPLTVSRERFEASAHAALGCRDCHADIASIPHPEGTQDASCGQACHLGGSEGKEYSHESLFWDYAASVHGTQKRRKIPCLFCHPSPAAPGEVVTRDKRAEALACASCHRDSPKVQAWFGDVHYLALARGDRRAPSCPDCHTAHRVRPASAKESSLAAQRLPETCGKGALGAGPGKGCHGALGELAVRGASMTPLPLGASGGASRAAAAACLVLLAGLVLRAGVGFARRR